MELFVTRHKNHSRVGWTLLCETAKSPIATNQVWLTIRCFTTYSKIIKIGVGRFKTFELNWIKNFFLPKNYGWRLYFKYVVRFLKWPYIVDSWWPFSLLRKERILVKTWKQKTFVKFRFHLLIRLENLGRTMCTM